MEDQKIERVESITEENGEIKVVLVIDRKKFGESFAPNYRLQEMVNKEVLPIIVKEILEENKEEIKKKVLTEVNWPDVIRSEIAQKVIKEIANKY